MNVWMRNTNISLAVSLHTVASSHGWFISELTISMGVLVLSSVHLPPQIKKISNNVALFKTMLKKFLLQYVFYSADEYYQQNYKEYDCKQINVLCIEKDLLNYGV